MPFEYHRAKSLPEAVALNAAYSSLPVLAGGTDLVVQWKSGVLDLKGVVDISGLSELKTVVDAEGFIEIGALASHSGISSHKLVKKHLPLLAEACASIGAVQIQNRGTIGGNIMNASPAGDTLPALLVHEAEFLLQDVKGERWVEATNFFTAYRKTAKRVDELLTKVRIRKPLAREKHAFYKIGTRRAQAISKVVMCLRGTFDHGAFSELRIALGSVAPVPMRAYGTEALIKRKIVTASLIEQARRSIEDEFHPIDDVRSTADYRKFVCGKLMARFLQDMIKA